MIKLKRVTTKERICFILDHLNPKITPKIKIFDETCEIFVEIGVILYEVKQKFSFLDENCFKFYEIISCLNKKLQKINGNSNEIS